MLLLNGQPSEDGAMSHMSTADLPQNARKAAPLLNTGRIPDTSLTRHPRALLGLVQQDLPTQNPHEEKGGLHTEQTRRDALLDRD